ncbi:hypothetical protein AMELA_G00093400 [Ameiurus melas]|uniref:Uncharacterized protein n=1 Tax=Ameiurus melas TaxID=219545 RepID=A0A7J6AXA3_AMEME|nr:hypothetical protein AMELA_G00093400 [Ameiurus melas]
MALCMRREEGWITPGLYKQLAHNVSDLELTLNSPPSLSWSQRTSFYFYFYFYFLKLYI